MDKKIDILFQYNPNSKTKIVNQLPNGCSLIKIKPNFIDLLNKRCSFTEYLWSVITAKNYVLYVVINQDDGVIHKSAKIISLNGVFI